MRTIKMFWGLRSTWWCHVEWYPGGSSRLFWGSGQARSCIGWHATCYFQLRWTNHWWKTGEFFVYNVLSLTLITQCNKNAKWTICPRKCETNQETKKNYAKRSISCDYCPLFKQSVPCFVFVKIVEIYFLYWSFVFTFTAAWARVPRVL